MLNRTKFFIFILLLICLTKISIGQTKIWSPYSRYGIGELNFNRTALLGSMGGASLSYNYSDVINSSNPASFSFQDSTSFLFNAGVNFFPRSLETTNQYQKSLYSSVNYLTFAFPLSKRFGFSLGLYPYSNVGYNIKYTDTLPEFGKVDYTYDGTGGINAFYLGTGFLISPEFSVGVNMNYYFGNLSRQRLAVFDTTGFLHTKFTNTTSVRDLNFQIGLQYHKDINKNHKIHIGAVYANQTELSTKNSVLAERITGTTLNSSVKDTVSLTSEIPGTITIPLCLGTGIGFEKKGRWYIASDVEWQNWEKFRFNDISDSLVNSLRISAGGYFIPKEQTGKSFFNRTKYLFGANYYSSYLELKNTPLLKYGISFGLGIPLRKTKTNLQISFEIGSMGTTKNNLIKENYANIKLGVNVFERWFIKHSYE